MTVIKKSEENNYLCYIPKKKHIQWKVQNNKVFLLFRHDKPMEKFLRWLVKKPYISDLELDDVGSKVWHYIDESSTVFEIGQKLRKDYGDDFDPKYQRLIIYLNYLNQKGWISFARGPQEPGE